MLEQKSAWLLFLWTRKKLGLTRVKDWAIIDMQEGKNKQCKVSYMSRGSVCAHPECFAKGSLY